MAKLATETDGSIRPLSLRGLTEYVHVVLTNYVGLFPLFSLLSMIPIIITPVFRKVGISRNNNDTKYSEEHSITCLEYSVALALPRLTLNSRDSIAVWPDW